MSGPRAIACSMIFSNPMAMFLGRYDSSWRLRFTGCVYDDYCVQAVWIPHRDNMVLEAFDSIAYRLCKLCEDELDYVQSKECILNYLDEDEEIYTEDGKIVQP